MLELNINKFEFSHKLKKIAGVRETDVKTFCDAAAGAANCIVPRHRSM